MTPVIGSIMCVSIAVIMAAVVPAAWSFEADRWGGAVPEGVWENCTLAESESMPACRDAEGRTYTVTPEGRLRRCTPVPGVGVEAASVVCTLLDKPHLKGWSL